VIEGGCSIALRGVRCIQKSQRFVLQRVIGLLLGVKRDAFDRNQGSLGRLSHFAAGLIQSGRRDVVAAR
jgi:hypothetical protein